MQKGEKMNEFKALTDYEIENMFRELTNEGWSPVDIARYEKTITSMAQTLEVQRS